MEESDILFAFMAAHSMPLISVSLSSTLQELWDWLVRRLGKKEPWGSSVLNLFMSQWNPNFFLCSVASPQE